MQAVLKWDACSPNLASMHSLECVCYSIVRYVRCAVFESRECCLWVFSVLFAKRYKKKAHLMGIGSFWAKICYLKLCRHSRKLEVVSRAEKYQHGCQRWLASLSSLQNL